MSRRREILFIYQKESSTTDLLSRPLNPLFRTKLPPYCNTPSCSNLISGFKLWYPMSSSSPVINIIYIIYCIYEYNFYIFVVKTCDLAFWVLAFPPVSTLSTPDSFPSFPQLWVPSGTPDLIIILCLSYFRFFLAHFLVRFVSNNGRGKNCKLPHVKKVTASKYNGFCCKHRWFQPKIKEEKNGRQRNPIRCQ